MAGSTAQRSVGVTPEVRLALITLVAGVVVVALVALGAGLLRGSAGLVAGAIGAGMVAATFGLAALGLVWVAVRAPHRAAAVLGGGAVARLIVYALALAALSGVEGIDRPALAISTLVAFAVLLAIELRVLSTNPKLFGVKASSEPGTTPARNPNPDEASHEAASSPSHASEKEQTR
ncbi:hypothetical protein ER308_05920 [Egibacter rhizosphaerae]|uniref:ATP synthase subunit I n=1 Tax=Egibacter rhizosphaerae TaxID=1670831 RepID=A0A411YD84_9ACTN|nr:hypothetical protein [Egibacter rhizosphaerae]QBI19122.1 hypothetical protein ER308_05920 [Egibacter rhizosphaerae]